MPCHEVRQRILQKGASLDSITVLDCDLDENTPCRVKERRKSEREREKKAKAEAQALAKSAAEAAVSTAINEASIVASPEKRDTIDPAELRRRKRRAEEEQRLANELQKAKEVETKAAKEIAKKKMEEWNGFFLKIIFALIALGIVGWIAYNAFGL
jgi:hypothetical protein